MTFMKVSVFSTERFYLRERERGIERKRERAYEREQLELEELYLASENAVQWQAE